MEKKQLHAFISDWLNSQSNERQTDPFNSSIDILCCQLLNPDDKSYTKSQYTFLYNQFPSLGLAIVEYSKDTSLYGAAVALVEETFNALLKDKLRWRIKAYYRKSAKTKARSSDDDTYSFEEYDLKNELSKDSLKKRVGICWELFWEYIPLRIPHSDEQFKSCLGDSVELCVVREKFSDDLHRYMSNMFLNSISIQNAVQKTWESIFSNMDRIWGNRERFEWIERIARMHVFEFYHEQISEYKDHYYTMLQNFPELALINTKYQDDMIKKIISDKYRPAVSARLRELGLNGCTSDYIDQCMDRILDKTPDYIYAKEPFRSFCLRVVDFWYLHHTYSGHLHTLINNFFTQNSVSVTINNISKLEERIWNDIWGSRIPSAITQEEILDWIQNRFVIWNIRDELDPQATGESLLLYKHHPTLLIVPVVCGKQWAEKPFQKELFTPLYTKLLKKSRSYDSFDGIGEELKGDVAGEVYQKIRRHIAQFDYRKSSFETWVETIFKNVLHDMKSNLSDDTIEYNDCLEYEVESRPGYQDVEQLVWEKECYHIVMQKAVSLPCPPNEFIAWGFGCYQGMVASDFCSRFSIKALNHLHEYFLKEYRAQWQLNPMETAALFDPLTSRLTLSIEQSETILESYFNLLKKRADPDIAIGATLFNMYYPNTGSCREERVFNLFSKNFVKRLKSQFAANYEREIFELV